MTLAEYLHARGLKPSHFARELGVAASTITRVLNGRREPGLPLIRRIVEATGGEVTANDFLAAAGAEAEPAESAATAPAPEALAVGHTAALSGDAIDTASIGTENGAAYVARASEPRREAPDSVARPDDDAGADDEDWGD